MEKTKFGISFEINSDTKEGIVEGIKDSVQKAGKMLANTFDEKGIYAFEESDRTIHLTKSPLRINSRLIGRLPNMRTALEVFRQQVETGNISFSEEAKNEIPQPVEAIAVVVM